MDQTRSNWEKAAWRIPTLADAELFRGYAGLYTDMPDNHPIIDKVEGIGWLYIAVGFNGYGFKISPAVGIGGAVMTEGEVMDPGSGAGMTEREEGCRKRKREDRVGAGSGSAWASPRFLAEPRNDNVLGVGLGGLPVEVGVAGGLRLVEAGGGGGVGGGSDDIRVGLGLTGDGLHGVDEGVEGALALTFGRLDHKGLGDDLGEVHGGGWKP